VAVVVLADAALAGGRADVTVGTPDPDAPAVEAVEVPTGPVDVGVVAAPLRFAAGPEAVLELADGRRYLDTLELRIAGGDQTLVNDLTIDDYVAGVAEMPGRWPVEALKAQAVAARTYAWYQRELGTFASRGYDICATVDCQAFAGASQQEGDSGSRWRTAVDETAGEVLLDDAGGPILARYFSTSGGRTLPNEVVFPSSGAFPYLVGIDDPADEASPYHRWRVEFTREEFDTILGAGEQLGAATPVAEIERLGEVDVPDADLRVRGADGTEVTIGSVDFRSFVSEVARSRFPDRFPTARADGLRPLPATLPSSRFRVEVGDEEVVVDGRGWGHGVGMGQYGARGRAEAGDGYEDILADYYAGLRPTTTAALPERMRVGLRDPAVGSVRGDAPFAITADGDTVTEAATGTWALQRADGGVRLSAPPGWGEPAAASRTETSATLPSGPNAVAVDVVTAGPAEVRLRVADGDRTLLERSLGAHDAGTVTGRWDLDDGEGERVPDGTYDVLLEVVAADGSVAGAPLPVTVTTPTSSFGGLTSSDGPSLGLVLAGGLAAATLLFIVAARRPDTSRADTSRSDASRSNTSRPTSSRPTSSRPTRRPGRPRRGPGPNEAPRRTP
jgi:SpoIID/LytB domain protein